MDVYVGTPSFLYNHQAFTPSPLWERVCDQSYAYVDMKMTIPTARLSESLLTTVSAAVSEVENSETAVENIVAVY